ncbi:MAG: glycosyltransferase family A protein [Planctomycetota bacterium]|jgi:hypothetical protein
MSIVVVVYDMAREAPRTLLSLSADYQRHVAADDYEVLVVDNGSPVPLGEEAVRACGPGFRYHYLEDAPPSPALAVNTGAAMARGDIVGVFIDGARIATPGLLYYADLAFKMHEQPTVAALGWHLGPELQPRSISDGYTREVEDRLLSKIGWPSDGYRLFEIASLGGSSARGCFSTISECNSIFVTRKCFEELGGCDTSFDLPGGGLANHDFYKRASERCDAPLVILFGEGTFHQIHGGVATNTPLATQKEQLKAWKAQYEAIRGVPWQPPTRQAEYLGQIPDSALKYIAWSAEGQLERLGRS